MKIRVWNAFASNNSGSYTIVGRFRFADKAQGLADELRTVFAEHARWRGSDAPAGDSPLGVFLRSRGVPADADLAGPASDEWPNYWDKDRPDVGVIGSSLLIHCGYTVSMPRELGQLIYAAGGRVAIELDHAHEALVAHVQCYWPYKAPELEARMRALLEALRRPDAAWRAHLAAGIEPRIWLDGPEWGGTVQVAAVFGDLVAGCAALSALADSEGGHPMFELSESHGTGDPLRAFPPNP